MSHTLSPSGTCDLAELALQVSQLKTVPVLVIRLLLVLLVACAPDTRGPGVDVDRVMTHVSALAGDLGSRPGDTDASRAAAEYIAKQIPVERIEVGDVELPAIEVLGTVHRRAHRTHSSDPNLIARFGPPGKALLIMAHYDTVPGSPGAIDNAAAVGVLIELAKLLAVDSPRPVILMFPANEETGLVGAEASAERRGNEIEFAIALDLIGGDGDLVVNGASTLIGDAEMTWLARGADRAGVTLRSPLAHRVVSRWWPQAERSDHGPFTRRGIRAIHFYNRGHDGDWIDLAYHSAEDVPARVRRESVDELARVLLALTREPIPAHDGDGFWLPLASNTIVPRWSLLALCIACYGAIALLVTTCRRREGSGLGLLVAIPCYAAGAAAIILFEHLLGGGHPAPWIHAPLRWLCGEYLLLAGIVGLLSRFVARFAPWGGERRYLAIAVITPLAIGSAWLVAGAAELAWIWLVPALLAAIAPRLRRFSALSLTSLLLPLALVLAPTQLREAVWNGFLPPAVPFGVWIATLGLPSFGGIAWYLRARDRSGPLGTLVLPVGCLLAIITGVVLVVSVSPQCSAAQFHRLGLACELTVGVR